MTSRQQRGCFCEWRAVVVSLGLAGARSGAFQARSGHVARVARGASAFRTVRSRKPPALGRTARPPLGPIFGRKVKYVGPGSTSSFCRRRDRRRRRRRRLLGRQAAGRGTTFGAGCAARRAAPAPSPSHLHSTRAHSAPSVGRCTGTSWPDLGVRAQLLRSARASRRAAKGTRAQVDGKWRDGWEPLRPPTRLEPAAAPAGPLRCVSTAGARRGKKGTGRTHARIKGGPSQYPALGP